MYLQDKNLNNNMKYICASFQRMTGEDFEVSKLPYSEIKKMNLQTSISYGRDSEDRGISHF